METSSMAAGERSTGNRSTHWTEEIRGVSDHQADFNSGYGMLLSIARRSELSTHVD